MKPLSETNQQKLIELNDILKQFVQVGITIERKFPISHSVNELFNIRFNLYSRFIHYLESISILSEYYHENATIDSSIGLIIRSGLSDYLPMIYLDYLHTAKNKRKGVRGQTRAFLADHLPSVLQFIKQGAEIGIDYDGKTITENDYKKRLRQFKNEYKPYFKKGRLNYKRPDDNVRYKKIQLWKIVNELTLEERKYKDGHPRKRFIQNMDAYWAYDKYQWYSKYDHFGIFTNTFQTQDMDKLFSIAFASIRYLLVGANMCLIHIQHGYKDIDVSEEQKQLGDLFQQYFNKLADHKT